LGLIYGAFNTPALVFPRQSDVKDWYASQSSLKAARRLRGQPVEIHHSQSLPEGQYYHFQLIGLEVWTTQGELLGNITEVLTAKSNDNYVVKGNEREILIPAVEDVVKSIDLNKGRIVIEAIPGLLSLNQKTAK